MDENGGKIFSMGKGLVADEFPLDEREECRSVSQSFTTRISSATASQSIQT